MSRGASAAPPLSCGSAAPCLSDPRSPLPISPVHPARGASVRGCNGSNGRGARLCVCVWGGGYGVPSVPGAGVLSCPCAAGPGSAGRGCRDMPVVATRLLSRGLRWWRESRHVPGKRLRGHRCRPGRAAGVRRRGTGLKSGLLSVSFLFLIFFP